MIDTWVECIVGEHRGRSLWRAAQVVAVQCVGRTRDHEGVWEVLVKHFGGEFSSHGHGQIRAITDTEVQRYRRSYQRAQRGTRRSR